MDAGSGESKNTASSPLLSYSPPIGGVDWVPWKEFVAEHGVADIDLAEYYLGHDTRHDRLDEDEALRIVHEFFRDLIEVGALRLPTGHQISEYSFQIRHNRMVKFGYDRSSLEIVQVPGSHPGLGASHVCEREVVDHVLSGLYAATAGGIKAWTLFRKLRMMLL